MPINLRCRVNKSMEIAQFSLKSGQFLSAREMFNMGFRYSHGEPTRIMVTEIKEREGPNRGRNDLLPHEADRWRWLLSRASLVPLTGVLCERRK